MSRQLQYRCVARACWTALAWVAVAPLLIRPAAAEDVGNEPVQAETETGLEGLVKKFPALAPARDKLKTNDVRGAMEIFRSAATAEKGLPPAECLLAIFYIFLFFYDIYPNQ